MREENHVIESDIKGDTARNESDGMRWHVDSQAVSCAFLRSDVRLAVQRISDAGSTPLRSATPHRKYALITNYTLQCLVPIRNSPVCYPSVVFFAVEQNTTCIGQLRVRNKKRPIVPGDAISCKKCDGSTKCIVVFACSSLRSTQQHMLRNLNAKKWSAKEAVKRVAI